MAEDKLLYARPPTSRAADNDNDDNDDTAPKPAGGHLTPAEEAHYAHAYSAAELRTFHCEGVCQMPLSGLDSSMFIGFVCRDEGEWVDLRRKVGEVCSFFFHSFLLVFLPCCHPSTSAFPAFRPHSSPNLRVLIYFRSSRAQDEPPTWPGAGDTDNMGLESVSDAEDVVDDGDVSSTSHTVSTSSHGSSHIPTRTPTRSNSTSTTSSSVRSEEVDTEEDVRAPITRHMRQMRVVLLRSVTSWRVVIECTRGQRRTLPCVPYPWNVVHEVREEEGFALTGSIGRSRGGDSARGRAGQGEAAPHGGEQ
ncbi:hypothetical protein B0H11DRAFT_2336175 [Mycena galericulata]|nr:hypothetical protein B0H11DRAFT_2336175 [Mycena galericulata]